MWQDILTILGFSIALLTWLGISPQRLRELSKKHILKNWLTLAPFFITGLSLVVITSYIHAGTRQWWLYVESSWPCVYVWLVYINFRVEERQILSRIIKFIIVVIPIMYLVTSYARLDNALKTGIFDNASPLSPKWATLGSGMLYVLLAGLNIGLNIRFTRLSSRVEELGRKIHRSEQLIEKSGSKEINSNE